MKSKLTILVICLSFLLYFLFANSYFLFFLGIIGFIYLIFGLPNFSQDYVNPQPEISSNLDSNIKSQKVDTKPYFYFLLFELFKAIIMIILGFGTFYYML